MTHMTKEKYLCTPPERLMELHDLYMVLVKEAPSPEVRELARSEAEYMTQLAAFRELPKYKRQRLFRKGIAPWLGNWQGETE